LSTVRFNRLHFFKRFDPNAEYVVLRDMVLNGKELKAGEGFAKDLLPTYKVKSLWESRKITTKDSIYNLPVEEETDKIEEELPLEEEKRTATIEKSGAWFKVLDKDGKQIGASTRDKDEAEFIKLEYEDGDID